MFMLLPSMIIGLKESKLANKWIIQISGVIGLYLRHNNNKYFLVSVLITLPRLQQLPPRHVELNEPLSDWALPLGQ